MDINNEKFKNIQDAAEKEYKLINLIFCPYLKKDIYFNAKGLEHLKFKRRNNARSRQDQYIRFRCLPLAPKIISLSHTLQGYQERNEMIRTKDKKKWTHEMKSVEYFEFIAVIKDVRVRIIVKKEENGIHYFWSIIPFWKMDIVTEKRLLHNGNPGED